MTLPIAPCHPRFTRFTHPFTAFERAFLFDHTSYIPIIMWTFLPWFCVCISNVFYQSSSTFNRERRRKKKCHRLNWFCLLVLVFFLSNLLGESKQSGEKKSFFFGIKIDGFRFVKRNLIISLQYSSMYVYSFFVRMNSSNGMPFWLVGFYF